MVGASAAGSGPIPSPNIWRHPEVYELENQGVDPAGLLESAMRSRHDWAGARVLDIGCGTGFHLPLFAGTAAHVIGVEPHRPLLDAARERVAALPHVEVRSGLAEALPVTDACIEVAHARWAYFFGPGCEAGLAELDRVMQPGGTALLIDNDATRSSFGSWFRREHADYDPVAVERFWHRRGFERDAVLIEWRQQTRADFEAVVRIEFGPTIAEALLAAHAGVSIDYAVNIWWRTY